MNACVNRLCSINENYAVTEADRKDEMELLIETLAVTMVTP
jgi:hypothetical protein